MRCMKQIDVVDYMLSLDLADFIEEQILVKDKQCMYTSMIQVTFDRTMIRCIPNQSRSGGRGLYDGRTIYAPIANDQGGPQMSYYDQSTGRITSRQINEGNVPQAATISLGVAWADEEIVENTDE